MIEVTKWALFMAVALGGELRDTSGASVFKSVQAVEREDGSNRSFNVRGYCNSLSTKQVTKHVRTID